MKALQYKPNSKSKIGIGFSIIVLLLVYYMESGFFLRAIENKSAGLLYFIVRDILPAVLILLIGTLIVMGRNTVKVVLGLLIGFYALNFVGHSLLSIFSIGSSIAGGIVAVLSIVFAVMVMCKSLKASYGAFATTFAQSVLLVFCSGISVEFIYQVFCTVFAMCVFMGIEDFEDKPLKKIRGEDIGFPRRNVGSCVILTLMTLGIFGIIWLVKICKDLRRLHGDENPVGGEVLLFLLVPFYSVYWAYDKGKQMFEDSKRRGGNLTDRKYVYMIMNILFMQLFTLGFIQTQLNSYQRR